MKRPILIITLGYILGILMGLYCNKSIVPLYIILVFIYFCIHLYRKSIFNAALKKDNTINQKAKKLKLFSVKRYLRYLKLFLKRSVLILLMIASIISNFQIQYLNNKYKTIYQEKDVQIVATIVCNKKENEYTNTYKIKVESLNKNRKYEKIYLFLNTNKNINLDYGDKIEVIGTYKEPASQRNYKGFDYKEYLKTQKIYGTINSKNVKKIRENNCSIIMMLSNNIFLNIKKNIENLFKNAELSDLFLGIMLGYTENIEEETKNNFKNSSISHILAVSGMHISYIILGLTLILEKSIGKNKNRIFIICVLIIYMFITGFTPSVVRAGFMAIITLFSKLIHRKNDICVTMSLSMLILLIYNPFLMKSTSVLLSFGGTIGIILLNQNIKNMLQNIKRKEKIGQLKVQVKNDNKLIIKIKEILSVSISAQIFILPIMILYFNTASISFFITNLFVSFIIGIIVIMGFILILSSFINLQLALIISYILKILIQLLIFISKIGSMLPLNKIYITRPSIFSIIIYYMLVILCNYIYSILKSNKLTVFQTRIKNLLIILKYKFHKMILKITLIIIIINIGIVILPQNLRMYFIDVGQGDSTLIITPKNHTILVDGGGNTNTSFDVGEKTLIPYLLARKVRKIDYMIISHFDQDHIRWFDYSFTGTKSK